LKKNDSSGRFSAETQIACKDITKLKIKNKIYFETPIPTEYR